MSNFHTIKPNEIADNTFSLIGKDWMLVTSGKPQHFNTMTASWGGLGFLWNKNVCFIFVRPSRLTYDFLERNETFSLSFFEEEWRKMLNICGSKSGRDIDKAKETGLIPFELDNNSTGFEQARLIIECKKLYFQDLVPENFIETDLLKNYSQNDYHRMYVGEILSVNINN